MVYLGKFNEIREGAKRLQSEFSNHERIYSRIQRCDGVAVMKLSDEIARLREIYDNGTTLAGVEDSIALLKAMYGVIETQSRMMYEAREALREDFSPRGRAEALIALADREVL